jgi:O-antigen/teichoic acid export membrane protein
VSQTVAASAPAGPVSDDARQAAVGTASLGVLQTVGRLVAMAFVVVATRIVTPNEWGAYATVAGLVAFAGFVADFGCTPVITRIVSREPGCAEDFLARTLAASLAVGVLGYLVIVAYVAVGPYPASLIVAAAVAGLAVPADAVMTSLTAALDGRGLIARRATVSFTRVAVIAGVGLVGVLVTRDVGVAMAGIAAGPIAGLVLACVLAHRHHVWRLRLTFDRAASLHLFRLALPFALLGGIGAVVDRLDLIVLSALANAADTARYDLAMRSVEAAASLGAVVGAPALFILARRLGRAERDGAARAYRHAVRVAYLIGLPLSSLLVGLHTQLARIAFGPSFRDVAPLLAVLGLSAWLSVLAGAQSAVVLAGDSTRRALRASLVVLGVAVTLDIVLIPAFDAMGAAVAAVLTAVASFFVLDALNRPAVGIATPWPSLRLVLACAVATGAMLGAGAVGGMWGIAAAVILPALLFASGAVRRSDLQSLRDLARRQA